MHPEIANYMGRIEDLRGQVGKLVSGLPVEALNWRPVEGEGDHATNSLGVLAAHVAGAEQFWIHEVIGERPKRRDRPAEFATVVTGAEDLIEKLEEVGRITREIFGQLSVGELDEERQVRDRAVSVRWGILHVVDHTALHLGHMQITYQLWNAGEGKAGPRWFERLKG